MNITKISNTDIPSKISSAFTDNTKSRIDQIGGLIATAVAIIPALAGDAAACPAGKKLESFSLNIEGQVIAAVEVPEQPCWKYTIKYTNPLPVAGAISWARFEKDANTKVSYFPVPACREVEIGISGKMPENNAIVTFKTFIADPDYIRLAPLPSKGDIVLNPICGADVSPESIDSDHT